MILLVNQMSCGVDLPQGKFIVIFVIKNIHQICIEWMDILKGKC